MGFAAFTFLVIFLLIARFIGRSAYFAQPIEAYEPSSAGRPDPGSS